MAKPKQPTGLTWGTSIGISFFVSCALEAAIVLPTNRFDIGSAITAVFFIVFAIHLHRTPNKATVDGLGEFMKAYNFTKADDSVDRTMTSAMDPREFSGHKTGTYKGMTVTYGSMHHDGKGWDAKTRMDSDYSGDAIVISSPRPLPSLEAYRDIPVFAQIAQLQEMVYEQGRSVTAKAESGQKWTLLSKDPAVDSLPPLLSSFLAALVRHGIINFAIAGNRVILMFEDLICSKEDVEDILDGVNSFLGTI